jgi:hypothetical protein
MVDEDDRKQDVKITSVCLKYQGHSDSCITHRAQYSLCLSTLCLVHTGVLQ